MGIDCERQRAEIAALARAESGVKSAEARDENRRRRLMLALAVACVERGWGGIPFEELPSEARVDKEQALELCTNQFDLLLQAVRAFTGSGMGTLRVPSELESATPQASLERRIDLLVEMVKADPGLALLSFREGLALDLTADLVETPVSQLLSEAIGPGLFPGDRPPLGDDTRQALIDGVRAQIVERLVGTGECDLTGLAEVLQVSVLNAYG